MNAGKRKVDRKVVVIAGPNGAGKSTSAPQLLRGALGVEEFVNADVIAQGISGFAPDRVAMAAGRVMMRRIKQLASDQRSFAFETTLASRTFAPWLETLVKSGYDAHVVFLWLSNAELAVARVAARVKMGGHSVPEQTIRRRYQAGLRNFFELYQPLANSWQMIDNSVVGRPRMIALGTRTDVSEVRDETAWERIQTVISE